MNPVKVEIGQYKEVNRGALKAFFTLVVYPEGLQIVDCSYFVSGEKRWFNFPQKKIEPKPGSPNGDKPTYVTMIRYLGKEYFERLNIAVLTALKNLTPTAHFTQKETYVEPQSQSHTRQEDTLPSEAPPSWLRGCV